MPLQLTIDVETQGANSYLNLKDLPLGSPYRITLLGDDSLEGFFIWGRPAAGAPDETHSQKFRWAEQPTADEFADVKVENPDLEFLNFKGKDERPRPFAAFWVWDYQSEGVRIWEVTQKTILIQLKTLLADEEIATRPHAWDLLLTKTESGGFTRYEVQPRPGKRANAAINSKIEETIEAIEERGGNLNRLFTNEDPFGG